VAALSKGWEGGEKHTRACVETDIKVHDANLAVEETDKIYMHIYDLIRERSFPSCLHPGQVHGNMCGAEMATRLIDILVRMNRYGGQLWLQRTGYVSAPRSAWAICRHTSSTQG